MKSEDNETNRNVQKARCPRRALALFVYLLENDNESSGSNRGICKHQRSNL